MDLARGLSGRGHQIFAALRPANDWQRRLDFLPPENFIHLKLRNSLDVFSAQRLAKFVREKNIEVIHAHVARDYPAAAAASFLSGAALVLTRHLTLPLGAPHRLTLRQASRVIAVSDGVAESLVSSGIETKNKISVIHNGVDAERFEKAASDERQRRAWREKFGLNGDLLVAAAGELRQHKGPEDFIKASSLLAEKHKNVNFVIVGRDNSKDGKYQISLENLAASSNMKGRIVFAGWQEEMADFYAAIDVFVSAARSEPFGLVIAEAMASGKPVVATATVGAKEIIETGASGLIVPIGGAAEIAAAVGALLADENLRKTLGGEAQKRVRERFSLDKMISETERIYQTLETSGK